MSGKPAGQKPKKKAKNGSGKKTKILLMAGAVIIVVLIAAIVFLLVNRPRDEPKRNVVVTKDNAEQVVEDMINQEYVEPGYYSASMSNVWHFATGDAVSEDAYVENVEGNTNDIYFDVFLADNEDEAILKSPLLPRGSELNEIALDTPLSAGTYDCVMVYHLVDEEQNTVSTLRVGLTIIVEG